MTTIRTSLLAAAAVAMLASLAPASAQDGSIPEITVTPSGPGGTGYYGAYGRDLPGVYMLNRGELPTGADIDSGHVKLPTGGLISNAYTYQNPNPPLPWLDAWHGTQGPGVINF